MGESIGDTMSTDASSTGLPPNTPNGTDATADTGDDVESDQPGQNADPDLITDDDLKKGEDE
ncbi:hypothetical protein GCM10009807_28540 [Microbacterium lacus]|uniref:Sugar ABC transporter ATPase n=2 Tax=Microbacterium lacus TaxID=415217 RepID=A0ABP4T6M6_9MICO